MDLPSRLLVDAWHVDKHCCNKAKFDPKHPKNVGIMRDNNSEAAEQLWSVTDHLSHFCMQFRRAAFRMFLRRYCIWRNGFIRSSSIRDVNPSRGLKRRRDVNPARGLKRRLRTQGRKLATRTKK
jgi:hypothetical protein